jgi:hypothetical protein
MLGISFTALAISLLYSRKFSFGGIALSLALLSGPSAILGLTGFGIAFALGKILGFLSNDESSLFKNAAENDNQSRQADWRMTLIFAGGTILLVGTLFFLFPQGLGSWTNSFTAFLQGWVKPSNLPIGRLLAALVFYGILPFVFGLIAVVRAWAQKNKVAQFLSIWLLISILLPLFYASRQVGDIGWALLPLWGLASLELARDFQRNDNWLISLGQAALTVILMIISWLTLAGLDRATPENVLNYWFVIGAAVLIAVLVLVLVYLGWGWPSARTGLVWGLVIGFGAYSFANVIWVSQVRPNSPFELWWPTPTTKHANLFIETLEDIALSQTGKRNHLEVVSLVDAPSIRWILRDLEGAVFVTSLGEDENPKVVIAREDNPFHARQEYYRGQDFGWWESPGWGGALPWEPISWLVNRDGGLITERVVIWARVDLFPEEISVQNGVNEASPLLNEGVEEEE